MVLMTGSDGESEGVGKGGKRQQDQGHTSFLPAWMLLVFARRRCPREVHSAGQLRNLNKDVVGRFRERDLTLGAPLGKFSFPEASGPGEIYGKIGIYQRRLTGATLCPHRKRLDGRNPMSLGCPSSRDYFGVDMAFTLVRRSVARELGGFFPAKLETR
jgi:hypothetical protein